MCSLVDPPGGSLCRQVNHIAELRSESRYLPVEVAITRKMVACLGQNARLSRSNVDAGRSHMLQVLFQMRSIVIVMIDVSTLTASP